ncbi:hypothetical protein CsSME_00044498 [Camellia sinensis var. sinensis]
MDCAYQCTKGLAPSEDLRSPRPSKQNMRSTQVMKLIINMRSTQAKHAVYASNEFEQTCGLRKQNMRSTQVMKLIANMQNAMRCAKPHDALPFSGYFLTIFDMADDIPQGGTPPDHEMDPGVELLPLSVRPFDPAAYRPAIHVLPPDGLRQFRSFYRAMPPELLLREPTSHLSFDASEFIAITPILDICLNLKSLHTCYICTEPRQHADTSHVVVHYKHTGTRWGDPIPFDTDMDEWTVAQINLLGEVPPLACPGFVCYSWFEVQFRVQPALVEQAPMTQEAVERYARGFLMFLLGTTIFADRANTVPLCLLSALVDARQILHYDWGGAALATLYGYGSMPTFPGLHLCQTRRPPSSSRSRDASTGDACGGHERHLASFAATSTQSPLSRVFPRTKAGRTHVGSSSWAPVPDDDDEESEAEAESEAESSEEETGGGTGSGSDDDADDAPGPSSRKRTRTDR